MYQQQKRRRRPRCAFASRPHKALRLRGEGEGGGERGKTSPRVAEPASVWLKPAAPTLRRKKRGGGCLRSRRIRLTSYRHRCRRVELGRKKGGKKKGEEKIDKRLMKPAVENLRLCRHTSPSRVGEEGKEEKKPPVSYAFLLNRLR